MKEDPTIYIKPELKIDQWLPIEYFQYIPNGVTAIHCDTRDFEMVISKDALEKSIVIDERINIFEMIKGYIDEKYLIHRNEIPQWLRNIEEISGGKCIEKKKMLLMCIS